MDLTVTQALVGLAIFSFFAGAAATVLVIDIVRQRLLEHDQAEARRRALKDRATETTRILIRR